MPGHTLACRSLTLLAVLVLILLAGCHSSRGDRSSASQAAIEFTSVPVAALDNPEKLSTIKGRVVGAQTGERVVLYARGKTTWWVQPFADQPFTNIQDNSKWSNATHPGSEYAALLVGPDFQPTPTADVLPSNGVFAYAITKGELPTWQRWWFPLACVIFAAALVFGAHQLRLRQISKQLSLRFDERLDERMRVAQDLHDTLLQGVLSASMQLHVAVDQLPPDSPTLPMFNRVLQLMTQVVDEGRNTVRGLRASIGDAHDLKTLLSRVPHELANHEGVDFRVIVEGTSMPLRSLVRDDIYSISREGLVNSFRHSGANRIEVQLQYAPNQLRIVVSDDGCGIDPHVLQLGRDGHWGLSGMRERAERIGAKFKVLSRAGNGTVVELRVPGNVAFEPNAPAKPSKWFSGLYRRHGDKSEVASKQQVG